MTTVRRAEPIRIDRSYWLLTLLLTVFAVAPLVYPGYMQVHSGFIPIYNLADLANGPSHLGWTPNIATDYDPLRGDGLFAYYVALPLAWLSKSPLSGVKAIFGLSFLLGSSGVFVWLRRSLSPPGAALAALVYTYLPYHLATVYVRGAFGEALFLGLLPWVLAVTTLQPRPKFSSSATALIGLAWAILGLSQAGLALWGFLLAAVWLMLIRRESRPFLRLMAALIGLVAAIALNVLIAGSAISDTPTNFFDHFLFPAQLVSAYWGFGASRPGWNDGLALGLGLAAVALAMLSLFLASPRIYASDRKPNLNEVGGLLRTVVIVLAFTSLLLSPTAIIWRLSALHWTLVYPWQLLGLIGLLLAAMAGVSVRLDIRLAALPTFGGLVIFVLLSSYSYLEPRFTQRSPDLPVAAWDSNHLILLEYDLAVEIPPAAAGLPVPTLGLLPLRDYGQPSPGDTLYVNFTWQATRPFDRDLKLFLHLLDGSGQTITQVDPLAGAGSTMDVNDYFTSRWDPGQLLLDQVAIIIPANSPPAPYRLAFGVYDGDTLERLPIVGRDEQRLEIKIGGTDNDRSYRRSDSSDRGSDRLDADAYPGLLSIYGLAF